MLSYQNLITRTFILFSFLFCINIGFAQQSKNKLPLAENLNGLDLFPVYKAAQKNSFIDSIIYDGPFITLCVRFEKPTSDGHYLFEAVNSEHGWTCETAAGLCHPLLIKNIRKNGQLISDYLKVTPLDLIFRDKDRSTTEITCEFQFLRKYFVHGEARLSESLIREYNTNKSSYVEFKGIRIRTKGYPKPLSKPSVEDYNWTRNNLLKKIDITLNEVPQERPTKVATEITLPTNVIIPSYKIQAISQNQLFLKGVWHTDNATIFRVQYYVSASSYASISLYNKGNNKYYIKSDSKKIKMRSIKNILINQLLLKEELSDKEILKLKKAPSLYSITYDVYFDRLSSELSSFDLIEGKSLDRATPFNFYSVLLK